VVAAVLAAVVTAIVLVVVLDFRRAGEAPPVDAGRQAEVAERGREVMPFDLDRSTHRFSKTGTGGRQTVTADEPVDQRQVGLIREHLRAESERFRRGDFADPARIHGSEMPGLAELRAGAARIRIDYRELPDGAQLDYLTAEPPLLRALHAWFDAQVTDHGRHAEHGGPTTPAG
jgi:hypothetical protein